MNLSALGDRMSVRLCKSRNVNASQNETTSKSTTVLRVIFLSLEENFPFLHQV